MLTGLREGAPDWYWDRDGDGTKLGCLDCSAEGLLDGNGNTNCFGNPSRGGLLGNFDSDDTACVDGGNDPKVGLELVLGINDSALLGPLL